MPLSPDQYDMDSAGPYAILAQLAEQSVAGQRGLPQQASANALWSGIGFNLAGQRFVAPMNEVAELLECPSTTRIPGVKPWVAGVANIRGRLLPLIDLEAFFGGEQNLARKDQRVLVLELGDLYTGVMVSGIYGMQHFPVEQYQEQSGSESDAPYHHYLRGSYVAERQTWDVFSLQELARDPQFFNVSLH